MHAAWGVEDRAEAIVESLSASSKGQIAPRANLLEYGFQRLQMRKGSSGDPLKIWAPLRQKVSMRMMMKTHKMWLHFS
jgi:hypothetical protein